MKDENKVCCRAFDPKPWDETYHTWKEKRFIKSEVKQLFHIPLNMGKVVSDMMAKIDAADAEPIGNEFVMMAHDPTPWKSEMYISVTKMINNAQNVRISGNYMTKVFDGPFNHAPKWMQEMTAYVKSQGHEVKKMYFYYTTCPKCAKKYGHNYVVAIAEV